jgi:hypothetical protein
MLQKVDRDVAHVAMAIHICFKCMFQMFHMFFQTFVLNVSSRCCICFTCMLQVFYLDVVYVCKSFQALCKCFIRMLQMFQLFRTYVATVSSRCFKNRSGCCICCNMTHPAATICCSSLGVVHARAGVKGWSAARQLAWEAEGDGSRGAGGPCAACGQKTEGRRCPD